MHSVVYVTCPDQSVADEIATSLVTKKLAACVNILPSVKSVYRWEGKVESSTELLLMIKTQTALVDRLSTEVKALHPYDCPEVISVAIDGGYRPYLDWINESTLT